MIPLFRCLSLVLAAQLVVAAPSFADTTVAVKFMHAAAALENRQVTFDSSYRRISYPLGDVPANLGVCADVVIRAYRGIGIDLQKLIHEDMKQSFSVYPKLWGLHQPDTNIDHRRVPNLKVFFARQGASLDVTADARDYRAGDLVTWNLNPRGFLPHIGIVMQKRTPDGMHPLVLHNMGSGQVFEDILFAFKITGHYRYAID